MSSLKADSEFQGEEITISAADIEQFCKGSSLCDPNIFMRADKLSIVVGNEQESYKGKSTGWQVPMDFAIKLGWKVCPSSFRSVCN